jgi:sulfatase maturation enzyme AslB (radical SAM superfamily)
VTGVGARLTVRPAEVLQAGLELMLSGRCNLACAYCYQDRRQVRGSIRWGSVRAALDTALARCPDEFWVEFSGGEPLLEPHLVRRVVAYLNERRDGRTISYTLTTNGTLLTREFLDFALAHRIRIHLSFDGVPAAQDRRAPGTYAMLDRLLDLLLGEYPAYFRDNVNVGMTLMASAIPHLAESVRYFIAKGVADIGLSPHSNWDPDWHPASRAELQEQVDEILEHSLEHWRRTGLVPVDFLSGPPVRDSRGPDGGLMCGAVDGRAMVVDPDGRAWACPIFAASLRTLPPLATEASRAFALGDVGAPALLGRLRRLPARARALRIFTDSRSKRSSYGTCAQCRFVADCHVCPVSICNIPDNGDPDLIPDFHCAFNQVTLEARQRFDEMTGGQVSAAWYADVREALRELGEAIKASSPETGRRRSGRGRQRRPTQHGPLRAASAGRRNGATRRRSCL